MRSFINFLRRMINVYVFVILTRNRRRIIKGEILLLKKWLRYCFCNCLLRAYVGALHALRYIWFGLVCSVEIATHLETSVIQVVRCA